MWRQVEWRQVERVDRRSKEAAIPFNSELTKLPQGSAGLDKSFRFTTEGTAAAAAAAAARVAGGLALEPRPSTHQGRTTFAYNQPSRLRPASRSDSR